MVANTFFRVFLGDERELALLGRVPNRHLPFIHEMGVRDDETILRLAENLRQPHDGNTVGIDEIAQEIPRAHGRQLVHIADEHDRRRERDRFQEVIGEGNVEHRRRR